MSRYRGTTLAPYKRFRPTAFYDGVFPNGTYTADCQGCPWSCAGCWSAYGWKNVEPKFELTGVQVAEKLIKALPRNGQTMARLSGGEITMYWDHLLELLDTFFERTRGSRLVVPGVTGLAGEPFGVMVETSGSLLTPERIRELEERYVLDSRRLVLYIGMKATSPGRLQALTGLAPPAAQKAFRRQVTAIKTLTEECKQLNFGVNFLDKYADPDTVAQLARYVERQRPGYGREISVDPYRGYGNADRYSVPNKHRALWRDLAPKDDEEALMMDLLHHSGEMPRDGEVPEEAFDWLPIAHDPSEGPTEEDLDAERLAIQEACEISVQRTAKAGTLIPEG